MITHGLHLTYSELVMWQCVMPSYYDVHVCMYTYHISCTYYIQCTYLHHIMVYMYLHILNPVYCTYYIQCTYVPASYYGVHACTHTKPCVLYILPTNLYPYLCMYRSRAYWRTVPRLRSGLRTRLSDGGGSIRGTGMGQTRKRRRKVAVIIVGSSRRQRRRRHPRTRGMILSLLFTPTILVGDGISLKWVRGS